jgi:hypothetical protein
MAALTAARGAVGTTVQRAALQAILEALKRFITALLQAGISNSTLQWWLTWIEIQLAEIAGAELVTGAAIVLVLIAVVLLGKMIYEIVQAKGGVAKPVGGDPCSDNNPIATRLTVSSWSFWGEYRAFKYAEEKARTAAQKTPCPKVECSTGECRGNCAITDIAYAWRLFWTKCTVTYDVYCECY